jgi:hypothetical protein
LTGRYRSPEQLPADDFRRTQPRYRVENLVDTPPAAVGERYDLGGMRTVGR